MIEPIAFTQRDDGVYVDRWPQEVAFSARFLKEAASRHVQCEGNVVTVTVTNGSARYRLTEDVIDPYSDPLELRPMRAVRISSDHR